MSEKIFACLLRLYPSRFREKYTEEAIQLYRDLYRHETGLLRRTGLWIGLLADLAFGLPQAYRNTYVSTAAPPVALAVQGVPTFRVLELEPLRPRLFLFGSILTLALLSAFSAVLSHPVVYRAWSASSVASSPIAAVMERLSQTMSAEQNGDESAQTDDSVPYDGQNGEGRKANSVTAYPAGDETQKAINLNERPQVIRSAVGSPDLRYPYPQPSKNAQGAKPQSGMPDVWVAAPEGTASAIPRMTPYVQVMTRDAQAVNAHNNIPIPSRDGTSAVAIDPYRATTKQHDCTFETIKVLPHNIGYFKLDSFPDPAICGASADEAMIRLNDTSAIILDLRENRGGYPETAEQIAAWLFERPAVWYITGERSVAQSMTHSPVRNSRLGNKPVYILTSSRTVDGAEQFVYNLKMLKRATVIGERTRGETHSRPFDRNDDHLGTGLAPDVEVKASDALQIAEKSARAKIERK
jgi:hypothetical protein